MVYGTEERKHRSSRAESSEALPVNYGVWTVKNALNSPLQPPGGQLTSLPTDTMQYRPSRKKPEMKQLLDVRLPV